MAASRPPLSVARGLEVLVTRLICVEDMSLTRGLHGHLSLRARCSLRTRSARSSTARKRERHEDSVDLTWQSRGDLTTAWSSGRSRSASSGRPRTPCWSSRGLAAVTRPPSRPPGNTGLLRPRSGARQSLNREWLLRFEDTRGVEDTATDMLFSTTRNGPREDIKDSPRGLQISAVRG
jgi:hypothetical protein